jgi:hypothetical protein
VRANSVARADNLLRDDERDDVSLLEFMGVNHIQGPRWLKRPAPEEIDMFWQEFGALITKRDEVSVAKGYIAAETICDILHRPIPGLAGLLGNVAFFFVDRNPEANWAHDCLYILLLKQERRFVKAEHRMPPPDEVELIEIERSR